MGMEQRAMQGGPADRAWLDLLHRELDGDLNEQERAALLALPDQEGVRRARADLQLVTAQLTHLRPPALPVSVAVGVAGDVAWSAHLGAVLAPSVSVASAVVDEVRTSRLLAAGGRPALPQSVAAAVREDIRAARVLRGSASPLPRSVAGAVVAEVVVARQLAVPVARPASVAGRVTARLREERSAVPVGGTPLPVPEVRPAAALGVASSLPRNPAPLLLVVALMVGLTLLAVTTAWPNLAAGALVLRTLLAQVSPVAGAGLALLLLTSALVTWRPGPVMQRAGAGAFALSALLTLPALSSLAARGDISFGQNVTVSGPVRGNVIAVGGNVHLFPRARVDGEVITLLGDVQRDAGAQVTGRVNALLGKAPGDGQALQTAPPDGIGIATAAAFRPVLGWLGSAAWPQVFVTLTGGALLLLFVAGTAPMLARRQRHAPMRTLALGVLALAALIGPAFALALAGLLGPALVAAALATLLIAVGLSVSAYDAGRTLAFRARLPVPDAVGALLGLSVVAATLSQPPLAVALALVGGAWGAGTLLLTHGQVQARAAQGRADAD